MKRNLTSWQIDAIAVGAMLAIAFAAYSLQVAPAVEAREERSHRATELIAALEKSADMDLAATALKGKLHSVRQSVAQSVQLEPTSQLNARLAKLTDLAVANSLQVDTIEPGISTASGSARYDTIPIKLAGRGAYRDVTKFLRTMHETLPDTGVGVMELSAADNGASAIFTVQLQWHTAPRAPHEAHDLPLKVATTPQN
jgi:Tfp pilus assembly protein PilO